MPPWTWMEVLPFLMAASAARSPAPAAARSASPTSGWSMVTAAACTAARAVSAATSMSAHMCFTAWKDPMGLPNCSRCLA